MLTSVSKLNKKNHDRHNEYFYSLSARSTIHILHPLSDKDWQKNRFKGNNAPTEAHPNQKSNSFIQTQLSFRWQQPKSKHRCIENSKARWVRMHKETLVKMLFIGTLVIEKIITYISREPFPQANRSYSAQKTWWFYWNMNKLIPDIRSFWTSNSWWLD